MGRRSARTDKGKRQYPASDDRVSPGKSDEAACSITLQQELAAFKAEIAAKVAASTAEVVKKLAASNAAVVTLMGRVSELEVQLAAERIASSRTASSSAASPTAADIETPDNLSRYERSQRIALAPCVVLRRVPEKKAGWREEETPEELRAIVEDLPCFFLRDNKIVSARRLGTRLNDEEGPGFYAQPRLVMVEMVDVESKMDILSHGWELAREGTRHISLDHAVTVEQRRLRAVQWPQIQEAKANGFRWFWSNVAPHKLIVATGTGVREDGWWHTGITP